MTRFISSKSQLMKIIKEYTLKNISPIINYKTGHINGKTDVTYHLNTHKELIQKFPFNFHTLSVSSIGLNYYNLTDVIQDSKKNDCVCIVDAEKYLIQDTVNSYIDRVTICQSNIPYIFKTYQMYRKDSMDNLIDDINMYNTLDIPLNINLIRGRYLDDKKFNVIYDTKEEVDHNYNKAVKILLKSSLMNPNMNVIFTTHNRESIQLFKKSKSPNVYHAVMMDFDKYLYPNDKEYLINRMVYLPFKKSSKVEENVHQSTYDFDKRLIHLDCSFA